MIPCPKPPQSEQYQLWLRSEQTCLFRKKLSESKASLLMVLMDRARSSSDPEVTRAVAEIDAVSALLEYMNADRTNGGVAPSDSRGTE